MANIKDFKHLFLHMDNFQRWPYPVVALDPLIEETVFGFTYNVLLYFWE